VERRKQPAHSMGAAVSLGVCENVLCTVLERDPRRVALVRRGGEAQLLFSLDALGFGSYNLYRTKYLQHQSHSLDDKLYMNTSRCQILTETELSKRDLHLVFYNTGNQSVTILHQHRLNF